MEQGDAALSLSTSCYEKHRKTVFSSLLCVGSVSPVLVFDLQMVQEEDMAPLCSSHMYRNTSVNSKASKWLLGKKEVWAKLFLCPSNTNVGKGPTAVLWFYTIIHILIFTSYLFMLPSRYVFSTSLSLSAAFLMFSCLSWLPKLVLVFICLSWMDRVPNKYPLHRYWSLGLLRQISLLPFCPLSFASCRQNYIHVTGRAETQLL